MSMDASRCRTGVREIKDFAVKNNLTEDDVNRIFRECFQLLETRTSSKIGFVFKVFKCCLLVLIIGLAALILLYNHPLTHNVLLRNLQDYIYPGLRVFRKLAVPIVKAHPQMTEWYDEWCLLENPYFRVNEMDCQPCDSVSTVQDLTGKNVSLALNNVGTPFVRDEAIEKVNFEKLYKTYQRHRETFDTDARKVVSNSPRYSSIAAVMRDRLHAKSSLRNDVHILWRLNRMEPNRKLRKLFPKLEGIPDWWSPSTEKFVLMDEPNSPSYSLPNSECANVVVRCSSGERIIELKPSPECKHNCKNFSILLTAQKTLWYNWWYWRPVSAPSGTDSSEISIMYLSSYC